MKTISREFELSLKCGLKQWLFSTYFVGVPNDWNIILTSILDAQRLRSSGLYAFSFAFVRILIGQKKRALSFSFFFSISYVNDLPSSRSAFCIFLVFLRLHAFLCVRPFRSFWVTSRLSKGVNIFYYFQFKKLTIVSNYRDSDFFQKSAIELFCGKLSLKVKFGKNPVEEGNSLSMVVTFWTGNERSKFRSLTIKCFIWKYNKQKYNNRNHNNWKHNNRKHINWKLNIENIAIKSIAIRNIITKI